MDVGWAKRAKRACPRVGTAAQLTLRGLSPPYGIGATGRNLMSNPFDLAGKVAVVTGSSKGIGRAIVECLAGMGAKVVVSSRKQEPCEAVAAGIRQKGGEAIVIPCNVSRRDEVEALVDGTNKHFGGMRGSEMLGAYGISKAADFSLARSLAVEWGPKNIRVNCVAPGLIKTDFARALWENETAVAARNARTPLRRLGTPEEIGGVAAFLATPAASYITGQVIVADGG